MIYWSLLLLFRQFSQQLIAQSIWSRLQGGGDLSVPSFLFLIFRKNRDFVEFAFFFHDWQVTASFRASFFPNGRVKASFHSNGQVMASYGEFISTNSPQLAANGQSYHSLHQSWLYANLHMKERCFRKLAPTRPNSPQLASTRHHNNTWRKIIST